MDGNKTSDMIFKLRTMHIFGYGDVQIIGTQKSDNNPETSEKDYTKKAPVAALSGITALINSIYALKPVDNSAGKQFHSINIFQNLFIDFQPKNEGADKQQNPFRVDFDEIDPAMLQNVINEVINYEPA